MKLSQAVTGYVECRRILPEMEPADAIRQYSSYLAEQKKRQSLKIIPFDRLVTEFLDNASVERKSARYINDMRARLLQAAKAFTGNVGDIEADAINAWLKGLTIQPRSKREKAALKGRSQKLPKPTPRTINNYRTALCTLFSYARAEGYLPRDKKSEAEHSRRLTDKGSKILFYTPEQLSILINNVPKPLVPFIALGGFAGLRTAEIVRLEWADIWFEKGWIEVGKHKAKTATRRLVPILPVLVAWLKPLAKKSGRVLDVVRDDVHLSKLMRDAVSKIVDSTGKSLVKTVHNGLRHSWVSYRVAETNNVNQVALEAGNSPKMIFQNYRELVTPAEAKSWFNILPSKPAKK
ncbi:MAG: site-specific integrase [Chthoniobacterales bacterium]